MHCLSQHVSDGCEQVLNLPLKTWIGDLIIRTLHSYSELVLVVLIPPLSHAPWEDVDRSFFQKPKE